MSINEVLLALSDPSTGVHSLHFVRATGKNKGLIKKVNVRKGHTKGYRSKPKRKPSTRQIKHIYSGTIPLVDVVANHPITPLISHIIHFDGQSVRH